MGAETLAEFLLARYDEDEARAYAWRRQDAAVMTVEHDDPIVFDSQPWVRVLADLEANRRIVDELRNVPEQISSGHYIRQCLALPYVDHPDWRDEWRP